MVFISGGASVVRLARCKVEAYFAFTQYRKSGIFMICGTV